MAKLDGQSHEMYPGEAADFFKALEAKNASITGLPRKRKDDFQLSEVRLVDRKVASGHKVLYRIRGFFRG